jgi:succinyldiaminopimelate transaminase
MQRRLGVTVPSSAILPSIGSKELVANLPTVLGLGADAHIVVPLAAYPTYAVGAGLLGARVTATDRPQDVSDADLIWINSPGNPTGRVMPAEQMRAIVEHARSIGAVVASDECYVELGWDATPCSVLHPSVVGEDHSGVLALHSLSKRSNFAGYRFGFVAGDPHLIQRMLGIRKHLGMMVPSPVQAAAAAAFDDDEHVAVQRARYLARREILRAALLRSGFAIDHSEAGLYLWATRGEPCWETVGWFAERGILVTPGDFYGAAGAHHVRVALTATDEAVAAFAGRLSVL